MGKRLPRDPRKETAILKAATHEFAQHGFRGSTDVIAAAAGVSKGSVFRYFHNKKQLYTAAVEKAMQTFEEAIDLSVWTDSDDFIGMIIRATQYKTELQHRFPDEFALIMRVYVNDKVTPKATQDQVFQLFNQWADTTMNQIVEAVLKKLKLRPELDRKRVKKYLLMIIKEMSVTAQAYMTAHPEVTKIEDMGEIIDEIKADMDMMEYGLIKRK